MEPENEGLEDVSFQTGFQLLIFQGITKPRPVFLRRLQNFLAEIGRNPQRLVPWFRNFQRGKGFNSLFWIMYCWSQYWQTNRNSAFYIFDYVLLYVCILA